MQFIIRLVAALSLAAATLVSSAQAQSYEYEPYPQDEGRDHRGFFARAAVGLGYSGMFASEEYLGAEASVSIGGISSLWNFAIGGSVTSRLAIHGVYFGGSAFSPKVTYEFDGEEQSDIADDESLSLHCIGAGLTFYTPSNFYLGAQLGLAFAVASDFVSGDSEGMGPGIAAGGLLGKEWFVTRQLGIGVAGQLNFASIKGDDELETNWLAVSGGPLFSLTFN